MLIREREMVLWTFLMPIVFFYFLGTVTGGFGTSDPDRPDVLALVGAEEGGFLVDELTRRLADQNFAVVQSSPDEAARYARRFTLPAPADGYDGLTASILDGHQAVLAFERRGGDLNRRYDELRVGRAVSPRKKATISSLVPRG